jgi:hypothetical protein
VIALYFCGEPGMVRLGLRSVGFSPGSQRLTQPLGNAAVAGNRGGLAGSCVGAREQSAAGPAIEIECIPCQPP